MLSEFLQDQAVLYSTGAMTPGEREQFELILEFHDELRTFVGGLVGVASAVTLAATHEAGLQPSRGLKARLVELVSGTPQQTSPGAIVLCGPDRLVAWVNPEFSQMCGHALEDLRGKSLGPILQGEKTDPATVDRMRAAVRAKRSCRETVLNYHKDGQTYWVDVAITPIFDDDGELLWYVAREREVEEPAAA